MDKNQINSTEILELINKANNITLKNNNIYLFKMIFKLDQN